ncbi:MAG: class I SAM-dependent methyltransferase [Elusimicrobiota bacterium]
MAPLAGLEEVPCNLCGSRRARPLYERPYRLGGLSECAAFVATTDEFSDYGRVVRCLDCGLAYTNPRPTPAELLRGYASCVDEAYLAEGSSRSINAHLSLSTIKRFAAKGRLLEVGSSSGYFLNAARVDFDVAGLEPSEWACRLARERYKLDVHAESLESTTRFADGSFDVVALIDVIEHLSDPQAALHKAARLLKPGGLLYMVTPDIDSLSSWLLRGHWWGLRPAHIYYFDRRTLGAMVEKAGLKTTLAKSFGRIFTYGYWASRLRHYPAPVHAAVQRVIQTFDIADKFLYLNTRDSVELCARKPS